MDRHYSLILIACALLACSSCAATVAVPSGTAAPAAVGPITVTGTVPDGLAKTMILPHDEPGMPGGPGIEAFLINCGTCHSSRYISMQPHFPRAVWLAEVQKMVKVYGAPVAEDQVAPIVDYLVSYQGRSSRP